LPYEGPVSVVPASNVAGLSLVVTTSFVTLASSSPASAGASSPPHAKSIEARTTKRDITGAPA